MALSEQRCQKNDQDDDQYDNESNEQNAAPARTSTAVVRSTADDFIIVGTIVGLNVTVRDERVQS